jgi:starch-binding outer membrane protein, SusD/RagB family
MKMSNKNIFLSVLVLCSATLTGCEDQLLNLTPQSVLTTNNFYTNAKDMNSAVLGIYNRMQVRKPTDYLLLEAPSDNMYMSSNTNVAGASEMDVLGITSDNPLVATYWDANYNGIFRANSVLLNIDKPKNYAAGAKDQYIGEAKFMRALFYFDLVRLFGGVPKVETQLSIEEAAGMPRATQDEIYTLIVDDLKDAIEKLPASDKVVKGRAGKGAAVALLGKVYVYKKDWANARTYLAQANTGFNFKLAPSFASLWQLATENNDESIFAMKYLDGTNGQTLSTAFIPNSGAINVVDRGTEVALPSWSLLKKYDKDDTRKAATISEWWVAPSKPNDPAAWYPYVNKYAVKHTFGASGLDLPVIRFADVVLLYAEALYELNLPSDALIQLNRIRERAFGNTTHNYTLADIATKEMFTEVLLNERQLELAYENERWFDLVRKEKMMNVMTQEETYYNYANKTPLVVKRNPQTNYKLLPIPQQQINLSGKGVIVQNDGY